MLAQPPSFNSSIAVHTQTSSLMPGRSTQKVATASTDAGTGPDEPGTPLPRQPFEGPLGSQYLPAQEPSAKPGYFDVGTQTPATDIHNHGPGPGYTNSQVIDLTKTHKQNILDLYHGHVAAGGTNAMVLMAIPTNVACCGHVGDDHSPPQFDHPTYYLKQGLRLGTEKMSSEALAEATNGQVVQHYNPGVDWMTAKALSEIYAEDERYRTQIIGSMTGFNPGDPEGRFHMIRVRQEFPGTMSFMGEFTTYKEGVDKQNKDFKIDLSPGAPINGYFHDASVSGAPCIQHHDMSDVVPCIRDDIPGACEYAHEFVDAARRHPKTKFIWAHMGLGRFSPPGDDYVDKLRYILKTCPNISFDISWDAVAQHLSPNPQPSPNAKPDAVFDEAAAVADEIKRDKRIDQLAKLMDDYPNRFFMGSDTLLARSEKSINSTYAIYSNYGQGSGTAGRRGLFDRISPATLERVLRENFKETVGQALKDMVTYEAGPMKEHLKKLQKEVVLNGSTPNVWPAPKAAPQAPRTSARLLPGDPGYKRSTIRVDRKSPGVSPAIHAA